MTLPYSLPSLQSARAPAGGDVNMYRGAMFELDLFGTAGGARQRDGAGVARLETAQGFPSAYEIDLLALNRGAVIVPDDPEAARAQTCFALIAELEDTNLLHRAGLPGLCFARCAVRGLLDDHGVGQRDWRGRVNIVNQSFVTRRLSPGGLADLLAMSFFVRAYETESLRCRM